MYTEYVKAVFSRKLQLHTWRKNQQEHKKFIAAIDLAANSRVKKGVLQNIILFR